MMGILFVRPLTNRHRVSRTKLAYLIDTTAAPVCIIAPILLLLLAGVIFAASR